MFSTALILLSSKGALLVASLRNMPDLSIGQIILYIAAAGAFFKLFLDVGQFKSKNEKDFETYQAAWHKEIRDEAHKKNDQLQELSNQIGILFKEKIEYLSIIGKLQDQLNEQQRQLNTQTERLTHKDEQIAQQALQIQAQAAQIKELMIRLNKYEPSSSGPY
jgi:hypothetical protein